MSYVRYQDPTDPLPAGAALETLYKELAAHLNADVKEQPKYKDLMNRILVAAMGNVAPAPVVAARAAAAPVPIVAPDPVVVPIINAPAPIEAASIPVGAKKYTASTNLSRFGLIGKASNL